MTESCTLVLPCRDEAGAIPGVLATVPAGMPIVVVDNGSRDRTAEIARGLGALVVREETPGYGAAVHAGIEAAQTPLVAIMDGDGSFDGADLVPLVAAVARGEADLAVGRRRPVARGIWPWHARWGNRAVIAVLRRRGDFPVRDIAPMRVCRRQDLIDLDVRDRRFGYPVEMLGKAARAGWRIAEFDVAYHPRAAGTRSKVSGSVVGSMRAARDFMRVLR